MTEITIYTVQSAITPRVGKPPLWILYSARRLKVVNISVTFRENISNAFLCYGADAILWPKSLLTMFKGP